MLSRRGLCQAFSKDADGYVRAEGGAVLVLRTREAAERDGDHIHGLIVGADVNSDGRTNGISLPSKAFQSKLLHKLYIEQGLDPSRPRLRRGARHRHAGRRSDRGDGDRRDARLAPRRSRC